MRALYEHVHTRASIDRRIGRVAGRQHGVFTRTQAIACGATRSAIEWRIRAGRWDRLCPKVFRLVGTPTSWRQDAVATCLHFGAGSAVSHRSAVVLRGVVWLERGRLEVTVPRNRNRRAFDRIKIHSTPGGVPHEDVTAIDGIPVTKPARTLLDLAAADREDLVERCLDEMLRRRIVSLPFLEHWLAGPGRSYHRGAARLRRLVDVRVTVGVTESALETQVLKLLRRAGLPIPKLQYEVRDGGGRFVARLDLAYPEARVAIEVDGFRYHSDRQAFDHDRARGNEVLALGWMVLRLTAKHVEEDPVGVTAWVRRALNRYA